MGQVNDKSKTVELEPLQIGQAEREKQRYNFYDAESFTEDQELCQGTSSHVVVINGPISALNEFFFPSALPKEVQLLR